MKKFTPHPILGLSSPNFVKSPTLPPLVSNFQNRLQRHNYGAKNNKTLAIFQKLQNCALRNIAFKKCQDLISHVYKEYKILKFPNILNLQNCLFMYQIEHSLKICDSFHALYAKDKHN